MNRIFIIFLISGVILFGASCSHDKKNLTSPQAVLPGVRVSETNNYERLLDEARTESDPKAGMRKAVEALEAARDIYPANHLRIGIAYMVIGDSAKKAGKTNLAIENWRHALKVISRIKGKNHPDAAVLLNNMAGAESSLGNYSQAENLYNRAIKIREKLTGKEKAQLAVSIGDMAGCLTTQGKNDEEIPLYRRALEIVEETAGPESREANSIRDNLSHILISRGDKKSAVSLLNKIVESRKKSGTLGEPGGLNILEYLANLKLEQDRLEDRKSVG